MFTDFLLSVNKAQTPLWKSEFVLTLSVSPNDIFWYANSKIVTCKRSREQMTIEISVPIISVEDIQTKPIICSRCTLLLTVSSVHWEKQTWLYCGIEWIRVCQFCTGGKPMNVLMVNIKMFRAWVLDTKCTNASKG